MKKLLFYIPLMFCHFLLEAQSGSNPNNLMNQNTMVLETFKKSIKTIEGTPYVEDVFTSARISGFSDLQLMKYNAYSDEVEVFIGQNKSQYLKKEVGVTVTLNNKEKTVYQCHLYKEKNATPSMGYFNYLGPLGNNGRSIFSKNTIKLDEGKVASTAYVKAKPAKFKSLSKSFYYSEELGGVLTYIPSIKRNFIAVFNKKDMKSFLKDEKIDLDMLEDIIKALDFYFK